MLVAVLLVLAQASPGAAPAAQAPAQVQSGRLIDLPDEAVAYIPATVRPRPPILVLLHGAGRGRKWMVDRFKGDADQRGMVILAPVSKGETWDVIASAKRVAPPMFGFDERQRYRFTRSRDSNRVESAIEALAKFVPVDRSRTILAGFSDGATFALTMGLQTAHPFAAVVAWSPGLPVETIGVARGRPVFVTHGRQDAVTPFNTDARQIVPLLRQEGVQVTFLPFDGGHEIPDAIRTTVLDATVGSPSGPGG